MELKAIEFKQKTGLEVIVSQGKKRNLINFWQWAYSDLVGNTERGILAEYLVALACNIDDNARISWDAYDLKLDNGIRIEVKSSGYLQTWRQESYTKPVFSIRKTIAWDHKENAYEKEKKRQADVYVFALLAHKNQNTLNPLDTRQWEFYIIHSQVLDKVVGDARQISLKKLVKLGVVKSNFDKLLEDIVLVKH